jgi:hypothetical protein
MQLYIRTLQIKHIKQNFYMIYGMIIFQKYLENFGKSSKNHLVTQYTLDNPLGHPRDEPE